MVSVVLGLVWLVAAVGLWRLAGGMAASPEQVPARFRAVLWLVKAPVVLLGAHASGEALLGADGWQWTVAVAALMVLTAARFELARAVGPTVRSGGGGVVPV